MTDLHLKFTDEAQATEALDGYEGSIDTIGIIYKRTDEEPMMTALPGWHMNVRGPDSEALTQFSVKVNTPIRVWA
jgi:hypothetical protein